MLDRRAMLSSVIGFPMVGLVKEENDKIPHEEIRAKAEMWDLFMKVCQKAFDKVERVGQQVPIINPSKRIGSNECYIYLGEERFASTNLEEVYIKGLLHRLEEMSK